MQGIVYGTKAIDPLSVWPVCLQARGFLRTQGNPWPEGASSSSSQTVTPAYVFIYPRDCPASPPAITGSSGAFQQSVLPISSTSFHCLELPPSLSSAWVDSSSFRPPHNLICSKKSSLPPPHQLDWSLLLGCLVASHLANLHWANNEFSCMNGKWCGIVVKGLGSGIPGLKSWLSLSLALWTWASHFISFCPCVSPSVK